jgi:hypothetical protein
MSGTTPTWMWMKCTTSLSPQAEVWFRTDSIAAYGDSPNSGGGNSWIMLHGSDTIWNLLDPVSYITECLANNTPVVTPRRT